MRLSGSDGTPLLAFLVDITILRGWGFSGWAGKGIVHVKCMCCLKSVSSNMHVSPGHGSIMGRVSVVSGITPLFDRIFYGLFRCIHYLFSALAPPYVRGSVVPVCGDLDANRS